MRPKNRTAHRVPRTENHSTRYALRVTPEKRGRVFLVGAGPGDPGLLTLRALELLKQADAVLYDALVHPVIVDFAVKAEKFFVGKHVPASSEAEVKRHCKSSDQDQINQRMVELARQGKKVVRLKGGDPFVFGRGGEEAEYLKQHGVSFEVIPGVSAGHAVPAFAGIPVTDRRMTSAVIFVTAHEASDKTRVAVDWKKLAPISATLVCFMGVKSLPQVVRELVQAGKLASTPVCVIEWGTLARQRVVEGTLQNIAARVTAEKIESPALTVIGEVVSLRKTLDWFGTRALVGKRIMITRATADAGPFRAMLESEGAQVCEAPMIKIESPRSWDHFDREIVPKLSRFGWILFTSAHAVEIFFEHLRELGRDSRALGKCKVAAVGEKTAELLRENGIIPDLLPRAFHSRELLRELQEKYFVRGQKFLWPRADIAPLEMKTELERVGAEVTDAILYHTVPDSEGKYRVAELLAAGPVDYVVFASSSGVKNFFQNLETREIQKIKDCVVSIGPQTSQTLREFKIPILAEAKTHNLDGLMETLKNLSIRPETEKPAQTKQVSKPVFRSATPRTPSQPSPRSTASGIQRFAPRPKKR